MIFERINIFPKLAVLLFAAIAFSCAQDDIIFMQPGDSGASNRPTRTEGSKYENVFLLYSAGYNNLSDEFDDDVQDILDSPLPDSRRNAILIFSHRTKNAYNYTDKTSPTLTHVYKGTDGSTVCDTVLVFDPGTPSVSKETLNSVLTYVKDTYPSGSYGMMFSSHGTGWLPALFKFGLSGSWKASVNDPDASEYLYGQRQDGLPAVRSIGYEAAKNASAKEIDIRDFADAIPMHLDYLIFDACLMGSIEVAYELKDKCGTLVISPAEILAEGMDYETLISYLMNDNGCDLIGFAENYYNFYNDPSRSSAYRSGTISVVDCSRLEALAETCKGIFETYRQQIASLERVTSYVQKYYTQSAHKCFYDLEDIILTCNVTSEDLTELRGALEECIPYRASTQYILGSVKVNNYSGLSMYLPLSAEKALNEYYTTLEWNKATGLIQQ